MRFKGTLTTWKDDQGFGFVTTSGKTDKFFVHIKSFKYNSRRPCVGDLLVYEVTTDSKNRPQAINIQFLHDFEREKLRNKRFSQQEDGKNLLSKIAAYPFVKWTLRVHLMLRELFPMKCQRRFAPSNISSEHTVNKILLHFVQKILFTGAQLAQHYLSRCFILCR